VAAILDTERWRRAFASVLFLGWKSSIAALLLGMAVSFLLFGFRMPYWRIADQDLILAYQGLLFNDGRPQEYFDHPGYLNHLANVGWYALLHWLGLLPVHALSELPAASDVAAFERAWQHLVEAGRVLSLMIGCLFAWVFATLMRRLVGDWRLAVIATIALAYSGGFAMHIRMMRSELLSAGFITTALLLVLIAARERRSLARNVSLALAGLGAALAVVDKVQALLPALAIPVLALAFGCGARRDGGDAARPDAATRPGFAAGVLVLAAAAGGVAAVLLRQGMLGMAAVDLYRPLGGGLSGAYQWGIALFIAGAMLVYAALWRVRPIDAIAAIGCVALGLSVGLMSLYLRYDLRNVIAVANPVEHMFVYAAWGAAAFAHEPQLVTGHLLPILAQGFAKALAMHTFVLSTSARPTLLLEWFAIAGAVVLWRRGERKLPLQVGLLIVAVWGLDGLFSLRGLQLAYFVYTDPLLILAAVLVLAHLPDLQSRPWAQNLGLGVLVVSIVWAHLEPIKHAITRGEPQEICKWAPILIEKVERLPFCKA
jgi:hypothetical protein